MGARLRAFDWAATPLGPISHWSAALRVTVDQMMTSKFPACLFWGPDLIAVYNDGYRVMLGTKPEALGVPLRVTWAEVWEQLQPIAAKALAGESTFVEDYLVRIVRGGSLQDAWFTFNYGPVFDEHGHIVGMLDTVVETTGQVLARTRQQAMLQQMPGFAALLGGPDHVFEFVNDAYVEISGPRQFIGRPVREVFPELAGQGFYDKLHEAYATGTPFRANALPIALDRADGHRFIDLLYEPVRNAAGQVEGIFVGGYDVTDRVAAEARLKALNADLEQRVAERTLARGRAWDVSPELLAVLGPGGRFEMVNPAWFKTLGWTEAELTAAEFSHFVHPDDLQASHDAWRDATRRPVLQFENRYRTKDGDWRWLSWVAVPEDGKVYCIARDVTVDKAQRAALDQRTAERDVLAAIVQTTDVFVQVLDLDFRFLAINDANAQEYEQRFGFRPAVGDSLPDLLAQTPEHRDTVLALWRRALAGETFVQQAEFGSPQRRTYEMKFDVLRDEHGRQIGAFHISTDITDRLREQRTLADMQEALRQAQKMEAIGQLTGGIAHDFNNLLAAISSSLQVIDRRVQAGRVDDLGRLIDIGERSVRRAAALTQRLLAFSRRQTLDPRATDVQQLMRGMVDLVERTVGPAVHVVMDACPDLWPVRVDAPQLENALLNLCINARDAMPDGGTITVSAHNAVVDARQAAEQKGHPGDYVCLCVRDTGTGMTPAVMQRVFDPFFTTKPLGQGTGLGLSMVHGFVHQSGGHIHVESTVGEGTLLCLYLPRHAGAADADEPAATAARAATGTGETVLLVEDEEALRDLMRETLEDAGYRVRVAADGAAGLAVLQAGARVDMLVTDVGLPGGINGRQLADAGRAIQPTLRVLFVTGYADTAAAGASGLLDDGMGLITKPFSLAALVARLREMLG
ncbi:PAS domain-containing protein [Roseateles sp.]|uniref:PAS domain-containing protein n=1 Tax=Roseateles sp. TaxID=1971397 RepID=UPI003BABA17A